MELPSRCKALLQLYLGGEAVGAACAKIVLGIVNPSGKLAETIPYRETDVPGYGYFGTQGEKSGHLDDVEYRESLFVGYRYYDTFHVPVRYCFGYGLSYTDFVYSDLQVTGEELKCPLTLKSPVPLSEEDFRSIYTYRRTHLSDTRPGEFTAKKCDSAECDRIYYLLLSGSDEPCYRCHDKQYDRI